VLRFSIGIHINPEFSFDLDIGNSLEAIGLTAGAPAKVTVGIKFDLDLDVGLDVSKLLNAATRAEAPFFELHDLSALATIKVQNLNLNLDLGGFVRGRLVDGAIIASAGANLALVDPTPSDKRVTISDITSTAFASLFHIDIIDPILRIGASAIEAF